MKKNKKKEGDALRTDPAPIADNTTQPEAPVRPSNDAATVQSASRVIPVAKDIDPNAPVWNGRFDDAMLYKDADGQWRFKAGLGKLFGQT